MFKKYFVLGIYKNVNKAYNKLIIQGGNEHDDVLHSFGTRYDNLLLCRCAYRKNHLRQGDQDVKDEKDSPRKKGEAMSWIVILCIYSYTAGLLLCLYAGMRLERDKNEARLSARLVRPAIIIIENKEGKLTKNE